MVIDGMPGAGKTSVFARLVSPRTDDIVWMPEANATLAPATAVEPVGHTGWYLDNEAQRVALSKEAGELGRTVVRDRGQLGILAYCAASEDGSAAPYGEALARSRSLGLAGEQGDCTVLLLAEPRASLARRGNTPSLPRWARWYDIGFLSRLDEFYRSEAPGLCAGEVMVIKTDGLTVDQVVELIQRKFRPKPDGCYRQPLPERGEVEVAREFRAAYDRLGGAATIGRPVTGLLGNCRKLQLFELGALELDEAGIPRAWNVQDTRRELLRTAARPPAESGG